MLNNKIKNILLIKDMSPSRFADEIGVQRSSISHILSGRNKPSLEIVQKIVKRFPELGLDWIIDEDDQADDDEQPVDKPITKSVNTEVEITPLSESKSVTEKTVSALSEESNSVAKRRVEKILIFYSDKTFTEYKPE